MSKFKDEDTRRQAVADMLESEKDRDDEWLIGQLISECECSFEDACKLVANNKADEGAQYEDR